jgi:hypothetical protein
MQHVRTTGILLLGFACIVASADRSLRGAQDAPVQYRLATPAVVESRLKSFSRKNTEREQIMKKLFEDAGCTGDKLVEQPVKGQKIPNVICTWPGTSDAEIIVGAHSDHVSEGDGVADDWSGAALLPSLLESVEAVPRKHTFVFVAFTSEEEGLVGSEFYAKKLSRDDLLRIRVMIDLDTLGLGPTKLWLHHSDLALSEELNGIAKQLELPLAVMNADRVGDDDSSSFSSRKIKTVMVHSVTNETYPILHSSRDTLAAIKLDDYYDTYKLLAAYLAYLDTTQP